MHGSSFQISPDGDGRRARYRAELLLDAELGAEGIVHTRDGARVTLPWQRVESAFAAEVGEPEGVRTIVFDLLVSGEPEAGEGLRVARFDADPGEDARAAARVLGEALGPERATPSIKSVAADGLASRWYPDLESFEQEALRAVTPASTP